MLLDIITAEHSAITKDVKHAGPEDELAPLLSGDKRLHFKVVPPDLANSSLLDQLLYSRFHGNNTGHANVATALESPAGPEQAAAMKQDNNQVCSG